MDILRNTIATKDGSRDRHVDRSCAASNLGRSMVEFAMCFYSGSPHRVLPEQRCPCLRNCRSGSARCCKTPFLRLFSTTRSSTPPWWPPSTPLAGIVVAPSGQLSATRESRPRRPKAVCVHRAKAISAMHAIRFAHLGQSSCCCGHQPRQHAELPIIAQTGFGEARHSSNGLCGYCWASTRPTRIKLRRSYG